VTTLEARARASFAAARGGIVVDNKSFACVRPGRLPLRLDAGRRFL
jgi:hypothetical protein